jgi:acetyl-CoA carboxylase biotin carboxyl carrier protein
MEIQDIEKLIEIMKDARISELTISSTDAENPSKITIHKSLTEKPIAKDKTAGETAKKPVNKRVERNPIIAQTHIIAQKVGVFHNMDKIIGVGSKVSKGQVIGQIESMKLMNDVVSTQNGVVKEIYAEDGMSVEYGQHLFLIEHEN